MSGTQEDFSALLSAFERSDWQEMTVEIAGDRVHVSRRGGSADGHSVAYAQTLSNAPSPAAVRADVGVETEDSVVATASDAVEAVRSSRSEPEGAAVVSPSVGIFWRAPSPTSAPFVEVGSAVDAEDTVGIVEVMKLMQQVLAGVSGVVTAIEVENGGTVEYGQLLVYVKPVGGS